MARAVLPQTPPAPHHPRYVPYPPSNTGLRHIRTPHRRRFYPTSCFRVSSVTQLLLGGPLAFFLPSISPIFRCRTAFEALVCGLHLELPSRRSDSPFVHFACDQSPHVDPPVQPAPLPPPLPPWLLTVGEETPVSLPAPSRQPPQQSRKQCSDQILPVFQLGPLRASRTAPRPPPSPPTSRTTLRMPPLPTASRPR